MDGCSTASEWVFLGDDQSVIALFLSLLLPHPSSVGHRFSMATVKRTFG